MENCMETEEKTAAYPFIKNNYYPGKLLHASDFVSEQEYGNKKREFVNRKFYGYGIIEGLEVEIDREGQLVVRAGSAIDGQGRIVIVPEDVNLNINDIEKLTEFKENEFVLGISYAERNVGRERCFLSEDEKYQTAGIMESYSLKAYHTDEWRRIKNEFPDMTGKLTQSCVLYEDETVRLTISAPRLVYADSIFRVRISAQVLSGGSVCIGMRGTVKLQGGFFLTSGHRHQILSIKETELDGSMQREWEICTDEGRQFPIAVEIEKFEVILKDSVQEHEKSFQLYIDTVREYREAVRDLNRQNSNKYTRDTLHEQPSPYPDWIPLAHMDITRQEDRFFPRLHNSSVRLYTVNPREDAVLQRAIEENGIVDIRWRHMLKFLPLPFRPHAEKKAKETGKSGQADAGKAELSKQYRDILLEFMEDEREKRICHGVVVIPVPKRYKSGQILYSKEIFHGFPGEKVFLWCGRIWEENNYAYWENKKTKYTITYGAEDLFEGYYAGNWLIENKAIRQDVEAGTFKIALTLLKGRRRNRDKEVAISWIAVRIP